MEGHLIVWEISQIISYQKQISKLRAINVFHAVSPETEYNAVRVVNYTVLRGSSSFSVQPIEGLKLWIFRQFSRFVENGHRITRGHSGYI